MPDEVQDMRPTGPHAGHFWNRLGDVLTALIRLDRRAAQADDIALVIDEYGTQNGTFLQVNASTNNPVIINSIIVSSPGSAAILTVGDRSFSVPIGTTAITSVYMLRRDNTPTTLTATVSGQLFLEVMGIEKVRISE